MAKKDPKEAADAAEARSKKAPKAETKKAAAAKPAPSSNPELDEEERALFLRHLPLVKAARDRVGTAVSDLRKLYKTAKAEGNFTKADFDTAIELETAEKEAKERAKIARKLKIAKIVGSDLGQQLDMFLEPVRVPAADRAYDEGKTDALQGITAKPAYDPSTEQYRKYMEGFHEGTAKRVTGGIKKLEVEEDVKKTSKEKAKVDQQKAVDAKAFEEPAPLPESSSGVPLTRAQFRAQQEAAKAAQG